mgnify:CR=1 FL=1
MSKASDILDNVSKVIVGKRNVSELVLTSIIAGGHAACLRRQSSTAPHA